jgi:hypothetical protein
MYRTGVMAPPTLYEHPPTAGLMAWAPAPGETSFAPSTRALLWVVAAVLAAVEVAVAAVNNAS